MLCECLALKQAKFFKTLNLLLSYLINKFFFQIWLSFLFVLGESEQNIKSPYDFAYNVFIPESGNYHGHHQTQDENGRTSGTYYLMGADGHWHETTFSDFGGGFQALTRTRAMNSLPEMVKSADNGLAVFFSMGKKKTDSAKLSESSSSPNKIPIPTETKNSHLEASKISPPTTPITLILPTESVQDSTVNSQNSASSPSSQSPLTSTSIQSTLSPRTSTSSRISLETTTPESSSNNENLEYLSVNKLSSPESLTSHEFLKNPKSFVEFKSPVAPTYTPTFIPLTQPIPLDVMFKKRPPKIDFGPLSGKITEGSIGELLHQLKIARNQQTQNLKDDSTETKENLGNKAEKEENYLETSNVEITLNKPTSTSSAEIEDTFEKSFEISTTHKDVNIADVTNESFLPGFLGKSNENQNTFTVKPEIKISPIDLPDLQPISKKSEQDYKGTDEKENLSFSDETSITLPQDDAVPDTQVSHLIGPLQPEVEESKNEDSKDGENSEEILENVAQAVKTRHMLKLPFLKQSHRIFNTELGQEDAKLLISPLGLERFKKPNEVINKINVINLTDQIPSLPVQFKNSNQTATLKNSSVKRIVLPRSHKLVDILRKLAKERPNIVSRKPFFVPLSSFRGSPLSQNLISNLARQPRFYRNPSDSLTKASNPGVSLSIAPFPNEITNLNRLKSVKNDGADSIKKNPSIFLGQPQIFSRKNAEKFVEILRKRNEDKKVANASANKKLVTNATQFEAQPSQQIQQTTDDQSSFKIVKAKLSAVRLLEPMPLSQYKDLIENHSQPRATTVVNFSSNQQKNNKLAESIHRPSRNADQENTKRLGPLIYRAAPIKIMEVPPTSSLEDTFKPKQKRFLMIKRTKKETELEPESTQVKNKESKDGPFLDNKSSESLLQEKTLADNNGDASDRESGKTRFYIAVPP